MREIWILQPQFDSTRGARPFRLLAQPRFRAAYDFLVLRSQLGEADKALAQWWTEFQQVSNEQRSVMADFKLIGGSLADSNIQKIEAPKRKRRPRKRKPQAAATD